jgi:hypothetical protein
MAKTIQHADRPSCVAGALITVELPPASNGGSGAPAPGLAVTIRRILTSLGG